MGTNTFLWSTINLGILQSTLFFVLCVIEHDLVIVLRINNWTIIFRLNYFLMIVMRVFNTYFLNYQANL